MTESVLKNNYFEFSEQVFQQISGTAIATKFVSPYMCLYGWSLKKFNPKNLNH